MNKKERASIFITIQGILAITISFYFSIDTLKSIYLYYNSNKVVKMEQIKKLSRKKIHFSFIDADSHKNYTVSQYTIGELYLAESNIKYVKYKKGFEHWAKIDNNQLFYSRYIPISILSIIMTLAFLYGAYITKFYLFVPNNKGINKESPPSSS